MARAASLVGGAHSALPPPTPLAPRLRRRSFDATNPLRASRKEGLPPELRLVQCADVIVAPHSIFRAEAVDTKNKGENICFLNVVIQVPVSATES